jgi:precorrin-2/cobalt-factor-2 C20-methyltransferase
MEDDLNENKGILYGLGVGPGDPELITLKAARVLNVADVIFAAASTKNTYSMALSIAKPHIPDTATVRMLYFPMTTDKTETQKAWEDHAWTIIEELTQGKKVAFITLGDSMTYSTYGYILKNVLKLAPQFPVVSIPGITSYQAAAACVNMSLVEGEDSLLLNSGANGGDRLRRFKEKPESVVFLKAYRNVKDIISAIHEAGVYDISVGVSNCGQEDEKIIRDINELCDRRPDYWTLILAKKKKEDGSEEG